MLLDNIHSPDDVKKLEEDQLPELCREIREFLVENISRTGGHLASNLGAVELTVAIHRIFDTSRDRLVFDVGHQSYTHKILTGRRERFSTLRKFGGLSGFPKPYESVHDAFIAGHASNSVSVALGMARARTLLNKNYHVLALIGDGAMTGGLAYEGINNAGASGESLIVILNDNGMSISPNVGGLTEHLNYLRSRPGYYLFKKWYWRLFGEHPEKNKIYQFNHKIKKALKRTLLPGSSLFEDMGFTYLGPVDGHNLSRLCEMLRRAKETSGPVLLHIKTRKGEGYPFARESPDKFHGVGPFDIKTGNLLKPGEMSFSDIFGESLIKYAREDSRICAITAAMKDGTGLTKFAELFPDRFFDAAIAEGHGASMAAGLASQGMIPVFAVYSTFLQRAYDMLIHDTALEKLHVIFGVDRAGLVGPDGETHHGCFDILFLAPVPGFVILCPSNFSELKSMLRQAIFEETGPVAVRYPKGGEKNFIQDTSQARLIRIYPEIPPDKNLNKILNKNIKIKLISYGILINHVLDAAEKLNQMGIGAEVWKFNQIAPLYPDEIQAAFGDCDIILFLEDSMEDGCVGQRAAAILSQSGQGPKKLILKNLKSSFAPEGSISQLEHEFELDSDGVVKAILNAME